MIFFVQLCPTMPFSNPKFPCSNQFCPRVIGPRIFTRRDQYRRMAQLEHIRCELCHHLQADRIIASPGEADCSASTGITARD